jgi:hypothetical protein
MKQNKQNSIAGPANAEFTRDNTQSPLPAEQKRSMRVYGKITLVALGLALLTIAGSSLRGDDGKCDGLCWKQIVIDVAADARTAVLNQVDPTGGPPKRGDTFILNGKIYPGGTIPDGNGFDIDTAGSIGTHVIRGTFNFDVSQALDPLISSTEQYVFGSTGSLNAQDSLMSEGQGSEVGSTRQVVVGGTGIYRGTIGDVKREAIGYNSTGFANVRYTFQVRIPTGDR